MAMSFAPVRGRWIPLVVSVAMRAAVRSLLAQIGDDDPDIVASLLLVVSGELWRTFAPPVAVPPERLRRKVRIVTSMARNGKIGTCTTNRQVVKVKITTPPQPKQRHL